MRVVDAETVHALLDYPSLVEALRDTFRRGVDRSDRMVFSQKRAEGGQNDWLVLPAWQFDRHFGAKLVSVFPGNEARGLASILGLYVLFDGTTGAPLAAIDGAALTLRKTAANSALAATYLARADSSSLLMVGAGALAPHLIQAHAAVRPIRRVRLWNRTVERARAQVDALCALPATAALEIAVTEDLENAVRTSDVISCATMTITPLVRGAWLSPGTHLDLVGAYRPEMRETDDDAIRRARIFVDARFTAVAETGDIRQPLEAGLIDDDAITDTFQLARGERPGRQSDAEITLFKSGGGGHEDLGTAQHLLARLDAAHPATSA
jgi:alanine dehydrogenase